MSTDLPPHFPHANNPQPMHDAPSAARQVQDFQSPQGRAHIAHVDAQIEAGFWATLRLLAVALLILAVAIGLWLGAPWLFGWIADRAAHDAALAPMIMRF